MSDNETYTDAILRLVIKEVSEHFDRVPEQLNSSTDLDGDLHADSLDLLELSMSLEETFDITIKDEDCVNVETIGHLVELVKLKGAVIHE